MAVLVVMVLAVVLLLPVEMLQSASSRLDDAFPDAGRPVHDGPQPTADLDDRTGPGSLAVEGGLLSEEAVRRRLEALKKELDRLDRDPTVFALAFRTGVARSAYEALQVEAAAFAEQPWWHLGDTLQVEFMGPSTALREVIEF